MNLVKQLPGHQGGPGVLHPHRLPCLLVLALHAPDGGAGVGFVGQQVVDDVLLPAPSPVGDAPTVQFFADFGEPVAPPGTLEYLLHDGRGHRVNLQGGTVLHSVADLDPVVAEGGLGGKEIAARGGLPHSPFYFFGKIFRVKFVHGLDDGLHQLAGGGVVGVLCDGDDADSLAPQHGLEGHGVFPLAGESAEFPDQNHLERCRGLAAVVDHLAELGTVGDPAAFGLVHVLPGHGVAVVLGVVSERPHLGGHGQVHVLAVAGHPGIESRRGQGLELFLHVVLLEWIYRTQPLDVHQLDAVTVPPKVSAVERQ